MEFNYAYINNLAMNCMFSKEEIANNIYFDKNKILVTGMSMKACFNKERLEEYGDIINGLIDMIPNIEDGVPFMKTPYDADGKKRAGHYSCELLMLLGIASGCLEYKYPRDMWDSLPDGMPVVVKSKKEEELKLVI